MAQDYYKHGGNIYDIKRRLENDVVDFSANINPLGLPVRIKNILNKNFNSLLHYPDPEVTSLKNKISEHLNVSQDNLLIGNGSIELIYLIFNAFKPGSTMLPVPSFTEYERAARNVESKINFIMLNENNFFNLDYADIHRSDAIFICNPNNPTGNLMINNVRDIRGLPNRLIIIDEAFMDFVSGQHNYTLIKEAARCKNFIVLRSFTKYLALPGLRVGYLVAHKDNIVKLKRYQSPWSVNNFAQLAAESMLSDRSYLCRTKEVIEKERNFLMKELKMIRGLRPYSSVANFIFIKIDNKKLTSGSLTRRLLKKGILIRDCANFRGLSEYFIRIAVRTHSENTRLIKALREVI